MNTNGDINVFYILIPIFVAVGIYLFVYSKKRAAMLKKFAIEKGLRYIPKDYDCVLENELTEKLGIKENGKVRSFSRIRDIVTNGDIFVFRCTQLLGLNPSRIAANTSGQICVSFLTTDNADLFIMRQNGQYKNVLSEDKFLKEDKYFQIIERAIESSPPKHTLSITIIHGRALIYLLPLRVGSEKRDELEYLFTLGRSLKQLLDQKNV